jgi:hypothetical protein
MLCAHKAPRVRIPPPPPMIRFPGPPSGGLSLQGLGRVQERLNWHAWRACVPQGTEGSNPSPSARLAVLDGEVAVPCTRNPL